jgi:hypothetical protein
VLEERHDIVELISSERCRTVVVVYVHSTRKKRTKGTDTDKSTNMYNTVAANAITQMMTGPVRCIRLCLFICLDAPKQHSIHHCHVVFPFYVSFRS